ncbi:unnamed protein product [Didymodactylos carnosus]|uniref:Cytochrome P450 n=1 Tax=Didymodactylos carnosus TaxID=1234261 RepID=A0A8S2FCE0_9BILA|nr:unnamed protein product [Didymodactylos carnosus]CAF4220659.1 unnamed protein product [Didymodactylos carnosus]
MRARQLCTDDGSAHIPYLLPYFGHVFQYVPDPLNFLLSCRKRYGTTFTIKLFGQRITYITDPRNWNNVIKNPNLGFPGEELGSTVFGIRPDASARPEMNEDLHKVFPKYLQNDGLKELIKNFVRHFREQMIKDKKAMNGNFKTSSLYELCHLMIFEASTRTLYGDIDAKSLDKHFRQFDRDIHLFFMRCPSFVLSLLVRNGLKARQWLVEFFSTIGHLPNESGLTTLRTNIQESYPQYFSPLDIGGNHLGFLWASVANTIPAAFWTLFYLLRDKVALDALRAEIKQNLPLLSLDENDEFDAHAWTIEKLSGCVLLESALNETMRMFGAPIMLRNCLSTTRVETFDGKTIHILKGDRTALLPAASHLDERLFFDPFTYKYDRFINNKILNDLELDGQKVPIAYMPFGNGKTMCPGRFLAKSEIKICLVLILQHIEYMFLETTVPKTRAERVGFGVAPPEKDIKIQYRYR